MLKGSTKVNVDLGCVIGQIRNGCSLTSIAAGLGIHRITLAAYLGKIGVTKESVKFDHDFFEIIDSEDKAYWLGFLYADGNVFDDYQTKVSIKLHERDESHLLKWQSAIKSCHRLYRIEQNYLASVHYSRKMADDLIRHGCIPNKSLVLKFPTLPNYLIRHFVRGYFDGDGCINIRKHQKKPQVRVSFLGTEEFLNKIQNILGINNKMQLAGDNKLTRQFEVSGNKKAMKIASWMYENSSVFLDRKKEIYCAFV